MEADALTFSDRPQAATGDSEGHGPLAYVVVVHKGPTWAIEDIEPFCRLLSRRFTGEVWAFGSYEADVVIGRMRLRAIAERPLRDTTNRLKFAWRALGWIEVLRRAHCRRLAVIALEPFTSGLIALYAAKRAGGALICEVNGVYGSQHNTANTRRAVVRRLRTLLRRIVGVSVLRRATAVRLLFADQLEGFARLPPRVVRRQFFETTNLDAFEPGVEEPIILGIGFPFRVKGFDLLCRAFGRISDRHPSWKLVLVGYRVPEEVREGGFGHPRIEAYPGLKQGEIARWMARCAIFALPSRTEAMGRVLLEAAAAGKCRVATRVDGIPTVVEDGVDGLLVESEDTDQLAAVLERAISDESLRHRLGDAAKERVAHEFSAQAYLDHYCELVSAALERGVS